MVTVSVMQSMTTHFIIKKETIYMLKLNETENQVL